MITRDRNCIEMILSKKKKKKERQGYLLIHITKKAKIGLSFGMT